MNRLKFYRTCKGVRGDDFSGQGDSRGHAWILVLFESGTNMISWWMQDKRPQEDDVRA